MEEQKVYLCIDLKSFYASVECVMRGLDPIETKLVVADRERSEKTICLAISPAMKELGIRNRCRLFEIPPDVEYITATPRMKLYIDYSAKIYGIYLKYIAKEDIHVYSIDEAFLDVTDYLKLYHVTAKELGVQIMEDIREQTGITATCGIGTNLYLTKIALDITAKHVEDHIGYLDEELFRKTLWNHKPLTDFWRIGPGTARRLETMGIFTMEQLAHAKEELIYHMFGIDAQLLIDHAWGRETTTIADIHAYKPKTNSLSSGQVLSRDYSYEEARLIVKEMTEELCLEMIERGLVTESVSMVIGYSNSLKLPPARGSTTMNVCTGSFYAMEPYVLKLYDKIVNRQTPVRRLSISFQNVLDETYEQYDLFTDQKKIERDRKLLKVELDIKKKFGKNAIIRARDLEEAATARERNSQIGGHKSGEE